MDYEAMAFARARELDGERRRYLLAKEAVRLNPRTTPLRSPLALMDRGLVRAGRAAARRQARRAATGSRNFPAKGALQ